MAIALVIHPYLQLLLLVLVVKKHGWWSSMCIISEWRRSRGSGLGKWIFGDFKKLTLKVGEEKQYPEMGRKKSLKPRKDPNILLDFDLKFIEIFSIIFYSNFVMYHVSDELAQEEKLAPLPPAQQRQQEDSMEDMEANSLFFHNLLLLGFDPQRYEQKFQIAFHAEMFHKPNVKAMQVVIYFLLMKLSPQETRERFKHVWPVLDRQQARTFITLSMVRRLVSVFASVSVSESRVSVSVACFLSSSFFALRASSVGDGLPRSRM